VGLARLGPVSNRCMQQPVAVRDHVASVISAVEADALAAELLGNLRTRLGGLHIAHARRVAARVRHLGDDRLVVAALLHDVVEKDRISIDELSARVRNALVMELVDVLTQDPEATEMEYLSRCAAHPLALLIKRIDLLDKLTSDDSEVTADVVAHLRSQARERLATLDHLAASRAIPPHRG
jgi:(p)ppGpp synthase/HD superfamily hydrolase